MPRPKHPHPRRSGANAIPSAAEPPAAHRDIRWRLAVIVVAGLLTYLNGVTNPFVYDDKPAIVDNEQLRHLTDLSSVLFPARELPVAGRPVVNVTFAINYALGELNLVGYHLVNIAIHVLCALVLFGVVRRALGLPRFDAALSRRSTSVAFATALVWAVHPLNSEVVDYLTQRTESMMAFFYLSTVYASLRGLTARKSRRWVLLAVLSCALGMACKESMVTAPVIVVLFDRTFVFDSFGEAFKKRRHLYVGLAATWAVLASLLATGPRPSSAGFGSGVSPWTYLLNQAEMITRYLRLAVWPTSLVDNYGWPRAVTLADVFPYAVAVLLLVALTVFALRKYPKTGFIGAWFFITLAPTSSIIPIATEVGAERRMYLPLAGLIVLAIVAMSQLWDLIEARLSSADAGSRRASIVAAVLLAGVTMTLAASTVRRNREYASELSLAQQTVDRYPTPVAHHALGQALLEAGNREAGNAHLRQALPGEPRAHLSLGVELVNEGKLDEAIAELRTFIQEQPNHLHVIKAHEYLGRAFARQERWADAVAEFGQILQLSPSNPAAEHLLAEVYFAQQKFPEAINYYGAYLDAQPNNVDALNHLGVALGSVGDLDQALTVFRRAVMLDPTNGPVQRNFAMALFAKPQLDEAVVHARQAIALQPNDAGSHELLARILNQQGWVAEAAAELQRSRKLDPTLAP